jgi:L-asparaginase
MPVPIANSLLHNVLGLCGVIRMGRLATPAGDSYSWTTGGCRLSERDSMTATSDSGRAGEPVRIFVTGGTFDKEYDELRGALDFRSTHVPEMLRLGRCRLDVAVETLMMIDSLEMTAGDRQLLLERCASCRESHIVITHGTDTMVETAEMLAAGVRDGVVTGKTLVLTGAMVPYAFGSSDGLFNLGSALSFVQVLPPGVYVAMNGRCFAWDNVRKNRETGVFEVVQS